MSIPVQDIPIVNNHPVNFERRIWPKAHRREGAILAKIHGRVARKLFYCFICFIFSSSYFKYHRLGSSSISRCYGCSLF